MDLRSLALAECGSWPDEGEFHDESGALAGAGTDGFQVAMMGADGGLGDGEAETQAAKLARDPPSPVMGSVR